MKFICFFLIYCALLAGETFETLYGKIEIEDPLVLELILSPALQRLKDIDQSGITHYTGHVGPYSRFIHSIGVYQLLNRFNASYAEQIAGLLHDTSHTVFSHVGDWLFFQGSHDEAYQDNIQEWFLSKMGVMEIVNTYNMPLNAVLEKGNGYDTLDQSLPDICADRLEYNLFTGHLFGFFTQDDIYAILNDIHFEKGKWYFEDPALAAKFARVSIYFTENLWGASWNNVSNELCAKALKRALELEIITLYDIHFSIDSYMIDKLYSSSDAEIVFLMNECRSVEDAYTLSDKDDADYSCFPKFRGIDPLVLRDGKLVRLTSLDEDFKAYYEETKEKIKKGVHVKYTHTLGIKPLLV
jgi:HD superfamily phosphohydrolase